MTGKLMDRPDIRAFLAAGGFTFEGSSRHVTGIEVCAMHSHPHFEIVLHAENAGEVSLRTGQSIRFEPGGVVVHAPGIEHSQVTTVAGADLCVQIGSPTPAPHSLNRLLFIPLRRKPWLATDIKLLTETSVRRTPAQTMALNLRAAALFVELLDAHDQEIGSEVDAPGARLAEAAERIIQGEYATVRSVGDLAERLSVSASRLRHVYKQQYGVGIKKRLIQTRLDHACELLATSTLPIKAVSAMCGFQTDRHFSAAFRAALGHAPGEHRLQWSTGRETSA